MCLIPASENGCFFYETGTLAVGKPVLANAELFSNYSMEEFCAVSIVTEVGAYVSNFYMKSLSLYS